MSSSSDAIWPLRAGPVVTVAVVDRLLDLERRGASFRLTPDSVAITPLDVLSDDDKRFLRAHRDDVRAVVAYDPPVRHLL